MHSLSRRFLLAVGLASVSVTLLTAVAAFVAVGHDVEARQAQHLAEYTAERSANLSRRFSTLSAVHRAAAAELAERLSRMTPAQVERIFALRYPRAPDGTRRSRDADFDGAIDSDGHYVHGMGAFLSPRPETAGERALLAAAFDVVEHVGEGVHAGYDNFYFATPDDKLVMFGPDRPDHLLFYRHTAPASLDFSREEMMRMVSPAADPLRVTRCTSLQRHIQDGPTEKRVSSACLTPVYVDGRYVGAFGSSLGLVDFMEAAVRRSASGATSLLLRKEGDLLAYPGVQPGRAASSDGVARIEARYGLPELTRRLARAGTDTGLTRTADGRHLVAFGRIAGPDWRLLMAYPTAALHASAARAASWVLVVGLLAAPAQGALILWLARRTITGPLRLLAATCLPETPPSPEAAALNARSDEIGVLGRALLAEREAAQLVMASLEERVRERTAELERASQEKSRFLANMSHELRTPLNGVIAVSEKLLERQTDSVGRELAELIVNSGRLLERVLGDVLDFSRLEAGEVALVEEPFALGALVERVARLHQPIAHAKALQLSWSVAAECDARFVGDAVRVAQVASNLVSNAVKFTEQGWVEVRVEPGAAGAVRITVADTGIGFDEAVAERLFARFEQADPTIARRFGGSGLGLAICRTLAEAMGGAISARSRPGVGSVFCVELPLRLAGVLVEPEPEEAPDEPDSLAGARVLLAEDHPTNQKVVSLILGAAGVSLEIVETGRAALEALEREGFDLVLMDVQMPEMDGLEAVRRIRDGERTTGAPRQPIIMLTANALNEHAAESLAAGADRHVCKPVRTEELLGAMAELLSGEGAVAGAARKAA